MNRREPRIRAMPMIGLALMAVLGVVLPGPPTATPAAAASLARISGVVRDPSGAAIPGARIGVVDPTCQSPTCPLLVETTTADDGTYALWATPSDDTELRVDAYANHVDGTFAPGVVGSMCTRFLDGNGSPLPIGTLDPSAWSCLTLRRTHVGVHGPTSLDFAFESPAAVGLIDFTVTSSLTAAPVGGSTMRIWSSLDGVRAGSAVERSLADGSIQVDRTAIASCGTDSEGRCTVAGLVGAAVNWDATFYSAPIARPKVLATAEGSASPNDPAASVDVSLPVPDIGAMRKVVGHVERADGAPLVGTAIAVKIDGSEASWTQTTEDGSFEVWTWPEAGVTVMALAQVNLADGTLTSTTNHGFASPGLGVARRAITVSRPASITGDLDVRFGATLAVVDVNVTTPTGAPLAGAELGLRAARLLSTQPDGTFTSETIGYGDPGMTPNWLEPFVGSRCTTLDSGACSLIGLVGASGDLDASYLNGIDPLPVATTVPLTFASARDRARVVLDPPPTRDLVRVSGTARGSDGTPLVNARVTIECPGCYLNVESSTRTSADGAYAFAVRPGTGYRISMMNPDSGDWRGCRGTAVCQSVGPIDLTMSRTIDLSIDQDITRFTIRFVSVEGLPLQASMNLGTPYPVSAFTRTHTGIDGMKHTDQAPLPIDFLDGQNSGIFRISAFRGSALAIAGCHTLQLPAHPIQRICGRGAPVTASSAEQTVVVTLPVSSRPSMGLTPGTVFIKAPDGTQLSGVSVSDAANLGTTEIAVVGKVAYTVSNVPIGTSIDVLLMLPEGSGIQALFKETESGYVDVTSQIASIRGDDVTLHLTDGGIGDEDGVANGVIVDPIVPARVTSTTLQGSRRTSVFGQPVSVTARVSAGRAPVSEGNVRFSDGDVVLATVAINAGKARLNLPPSLASGSHRIAAEYLGTDSLPPSTSNAVDLTISPAITRMALRGPSQVDPGATITLSAQVRTRGPGRGNATGIVTFTEGAIVLGSAPIDAYGNATFAVVLPPGGHTVNAAYVGGINHLPANSARTLTVH